MAALEDLGYYSVDNLPVELLPKFLELPMERSTEITEFAFVMDLREKGFVTKYQSIFESIREKASAFEILFLEADEETLLQRYSETRRQHPLAQDKRLLEGIRTEQAQLADLRKAADRIIDTSHYNVHELKAMILNVAKKRLAVSSLTINLLSFGFKYGIPHDADLIMDVRFLANPHFIAELKALNGQADTVKDFILGREEARLFLEKYLDLLDLLIPLYEKEGKTYLTIAVGCTGGRHRSVTIAESLFNHIHTPGRRVDVTHRDIEL